MLNWLYSKKLKNENKQLEKNNNLIQRLGKKTINKRFIRKNLNKEKQKKKPNEKSTRFRNKRHWKFEKGKKRKKKEKSKNREILLLKLE